MQPSNPPEFIAREIVDVISWMFSDGIALKGPHDRHVGVNPEWLSVYGIPVIGDYWLVDIFGNVTLCRRAEFLAHYEHITGWRYRRVGAPVFTMEG